MSKWNSIEQQSYHILEQLTAQAASSNDEHFAGL